MSELIRTQFSLPALRISMQFKGDQSIVLIRAYEGDRELASESVPTESVGIRDRLNPYGYRDVTFRLPADLISRLNAALSAVRDEGEPVWLQIDRSAHHLALVPWEHLIAPAVIGPILRIPNFLLDPIFIDDRLTLVICASAPAAKEFFPVYEFASSLVGIAQRAVAQGTDIHVFADLSAFNELAGRFGQYRQGNHSVTVHNPEDTPSSEGGQGDSSSLSGKQPSPWLQWIRTEIGERAVDAVHFVCPGMFNSSYGSLALAESPARNLETQVSHFIEANELSAFLNDIGAWALLLGAPYSGIWALGLRLLADEIAWKRPGPVMLYETHTSAPAVEQAYAFLFSEPPQAPGTKGDYLLYCHPRYLACYDRDPGEYPSFTASTLNTRQPGHEWLQSLIQQMPGVPARGASQPASKSPAPRWTRTNKLVLDQAFARIATRHEDAARGASDALQYLLQVYDRFTKEVK